MNMNKNFDEILKSEIQYILANHWDPMKTTVSILEGDYDSYVLRIYSMFMQKKTKNDAFNYLWWLESHHMGLTGNKEHIQKVVDQLFEVFTQHYNKSQGVDMDK